MTVSDKLFSICLRDCGQRTTGQCKSIILQLGVNKENLLTFNDIPFQNPSDNFLQKSFDHECAWTVILEADLLLFKPSISKLVEVIEKVDSHESGIFSLRVFDKFIGVPVHKSNYILRTKEARAAYLAHQKSLNSKLTAWQAVTQELMGKGAKNFHIIKDIIGIKGTEQYYWDIYRNCFHYGSRYLQHATELLSFYRKYCLVDSDFKIALKGFVDGVYTDSAKPDKRHLIPFMKNYKLQEKPPIPSQPIWDAEKLLTRLPINQRLLADERAQK